MWDPIGRCSSPLLVGLILALIITGVSGGCGPGEQPTPTLPPVAESTPTPPPTVVVSPIAPQVPLIENDSLVTAEIVSITLASSTEPSHRMELKVLASQDVEDYRNFTKDKVGQVIAVRVSRAEDISGLQVGDTITAHASLRGNEHGTAFFAFSIAKKSSGQPMGPSIGVPLVDNDSLVTAEIVSLVQASGDQTFHRMEIKMLASQDVEGEVNLTKGTIGQTISVRVPKAEDISTLQVGDTITARVRARGDEHGVGFYAMSLSKK